MIDDDVEREQFEKWAAPFDVSLPLKRDTLVPGRYKVERTAMAWTCWQASAKLSRAAGEAAGLEKAARSLEDKIATLSRLPGSDYEYGVSKGCEIALQILRALSTPPKETKENPNV